MSAPVRRDEEWANALTHGLAALCWLAVGGWLVDRSLTHNVGLAIACAAYAATVVGTFTSSTLSHTFLQQPWLNRFRAWDQAMIYLMITGTYTPIVYGFALDAQRTWLLWAIWIAATIGFLGKIALRHRINHIGTLSYLLLGWLPAIPLYGQVPLELGLMMLLGGVLYTVGVAILMNDFRHKYMHAAWHLLVIGASVVHGLGIVWYVIAPSAA